MVDNTKLTITLEVDFSTIKAMSIFNADMKELLEGIDSFEGVTEEHVKEALKALNEKGGVEQIKIFVGLTAIGLAHNK